MAAMFGEIQYSTLDGNVHSDLSGDGTDIATRGLLHACLDEWLDKGNGTGGFYVGHAHLDDDCPRSEVDAVLAAELRRLSEAYQAEADRLDVADRRVPGLATAAGRLALRADELDPQGSAQ